MFYFLVLLQCTGDDFKRGLIQTVNSLKLLTSSAVIWKHHVQFVIINFYFKVNYLTITLNGIILVELTHQLPVQLVVNTKYFELHKSVSLVCHKGKNCISL